MHWFGAKNVARLSVCPSMLTAMMNPFHHGVLTVILAFGLAETARGQAEANVWGGLRGIRVEGELMTFTTGFRAVPVGQPPVGPAQQERLSNPQFVRQGVQQTSSGGLMAGGGGGRRGAAPPATVPGARGRGGAGNVVNGQVTYEDVGTGRVNVTVTVSATADTSLAGIYFIVHLPMADYADGTAQLVDPVASAPPAAITGGGSLPSGAAKGVRVTAAHRQLEVTLATAADIVVQPGGGGRGPGAPRGIDVYFPVCTGTMAAGQTTRVSFTLQAAGDVDRSPITVVIDPAHPGSPFLGIGGNFRMQQAADAPQAAYNLENLRVPWARADLPLAAWQPTEDGPPNPNGGTGYFGAVAPALAMQKILSQKKIPVILSVWSLPEWARSAEPPRRPGANGGSG